MKVMILCGGQGTRLRELTELRPKPMVEIGGRPILWHIMKSFAHHGFKEFVLCLGYKAWTIKEYFLNYESMNSDFTIELGRNGIIELQGNAHQEDGWRITLCHTGENSMTGARVKRASRYLGPGDEPFFLTYGDGVANVDIRALLKFHLAHGKAATVTGVRPPSRFGTLESVDNKVLNFKEKPQSGQGLVNGGFFALERGFLKYLTEDEGCILERSPLERCAQEGQLHLYEHGGFWQCMDTYRDWQALEDMWQKGEAPWKVWP
ncbi:MAG: glucose-1-phosphate cytidylyltransferase [Planctomycetes bacterium]|nr:glucose-1-phosphate cytidylyltransferase [Planctomycetota bacterium]